MKRKVLVISMLAVAGLAAEAPQWRKLVLLDVGKRFTAATSVLDSEKDWKRYSPVNLFDGDTGTCWAVGNKGIGAKVYMIIEEGSSAITFINGLAKNQKLFLANNRVRSMKAAVLLGVTWGGRVTEIGPVYDVLPLGREQVIHLEDHGLPQKLRLPFKWGDLAASAKKAMERYNEREAPEPAALARRYILSLEIRAVYPGRLYNDTCISEIDIVP